MPDLSHLMDPADAAYAAWVEGVARRTGTSFAAVLRALAGELDVTGDQPPDVARDWEKKAIATCIWCVATVCRAAGLGRPGGGAALFDQVVSSVAATLVQDGTLPPHHKVSLRLPLGPVQPKPAPKPAKRVVNVQWDEEEAV